MHNHSYHDYYQGSGLAKYQAKMNYFTICKQAYGFLLYGCVCVRQQQMIRIQ